MAQVKVITARFGRKRQPAQYESAEAMIEFTISAEEDGTMGNVSVEQIGMGEQLLGIAKDLVLRELGVIKPGETASAAKLAPAAAAAAAAPAAGDAAAKPATGRKKTEAAKPASAPAQATAPAPAATGRQISDNPEDRKDPENSDLPADDTAVATTAPAANPDLPAEGSDAPAAKATPVTLTVGELHTFIAGNIKSKKLDHKTVKDTSQSFGVERIADLKPEQLGPYKVALDNAIKKLGANPDTSDL